MHFARWRSLASRSPLTFVLRLTSGGGRIADRHWRPACVTLTAVADATFDADVARARALLDKFRPWIDRYRGGLPAGWMAAIMLHESGGNFGAAGDASLGEIGYYQIASYVPPLFGYDPSARADPETNVALASLEYGLEAALWSKDFPQVNLGSPDSWKLARLSFAVGRAGSRTLAAMTLAAQGALTPGDVYGDIARWAAMSGAVPLGSQSAATVQRRVLDIQRQWAIGQAVTPGLSGPPTLIPAPPAGPYTIPIAAAPYFAEPISGTLILIGGGLALLIYLIARRK